MILNENDIINKPYNERYFEFGIEGTIFVTEYKFELTLIFLCLVTYVPVAILNRVIKKPSK